MGKSVYVCETKDLHEGEMKLVSGIDRVDVLVVNNDGKYVAITNICTHKGAPLSDGKIRGKYIECPWHKANFRLDNGHHSWPALRSVRSYPVRVEGTSIFVDQDTEHPNMHD